MKWLIAGALGFLALRSKAKAAMGQIGRVAVAYQPVHKIAPTAANPVDVVATVSWTGTAKDASGKAIAWPYRLCMRLADGSTQVGPTSCVLRTVAGQRQDTLAVGLPVGAAGKTLNVFIELQAAPPDSQGKPNTSGQYTFEGRKVLMGEVVVAPASSSSTSSSATGSTSVNGGIGSVSVSQGLRLGGLRRSR